ncbi:MAG TPA: hypothetical protein VNA14_00915 [Mycobacteriales bacterium]|nr:hypothetical protein [Mycobacteriales bacterium]
MIAALLSSRVRQWAIATVAAPVVVWGLDQVADELERRQGSAKGADRLRKVGRVVERVSGRRRRTPAARRPRSAASR